MRFVEKLVLWHCTCEINFTAYCRLQHHLLKPICCAYGIHNKWASMQIDNLSICLIIVQYLVAYQLAKVGKWVQLFTDWTSWWHMLFQNLAISINENELSFPLVVTSFIFFQDKTMESFCWWRKQHSWKYGCYFMWGISCLHWKNWNI